MLTETDTAGQTILRNIGLFTYMIPVGLCSATGFLTGKYIGKDKASLALKISNLCMYVTFCWSLSSMLLVYFFKDEIMGFYTHDKTVQAKMNEAWYVLTIFVFFDCMQGVDVGNLSGLGIMSRVKLVTIFDYWVVGIPISMFMMFN